MLDGSEEPSDLGEYLLFFILNADHVPRKITLPDPGEKMNWYRVVDTGLPAGEDFPEEGREVPLKSGDPYTALPRTTVVILGRR
jgi:hypothetical protein